MQLHINPNTNETFLSPYSPHDYHTSKWATLEGLRLFPLMQCHESNLWAENYQSVQICIPILTPLAQLSCLDSVIDS